MNAKKLWILAIVMMIAAAPSFAGEATQMWRCEMDDDATEAQVVAHAGEWLKAAKTVNGGAGLKAYVYFPVAVNAMGETDVMFVVSAPTFEEWGKFWDAYPNSAAAKLETEGHSMIVCPDSVLWESVTVK